MKRLKNRLFRPVGDWAPRGYPTSSRIAEALCAHPALFALRSRRLIADIAATHRCGIATARHALRIARETLGGV